MNGKSLSLIIAALLVATSPYAARGAAVVAPGAKIEKLAGGFKFTEGPAADANGDIYFSDIPNNRIHKWSVERKKLSTFRENSGGSNGLYFDGKGHLLACEGTGRRLVSIDQRGEVTVVTDRYRDKKYNSLNDLWVTPRGGIYFTDPRYGKRDGMEQDGEHVYYITPERTKVIKVIDEMVRPNGLIGTPDGKRLYVADHGADRTYSYRIKKDGSLARKKLFVAKGSDGMTIDDRGNVYLTDPKGKAVLVYDPKGELIETIKVPEGPANVTFGGKDKQTLFITARTSLYAIRMRVKGT